VGPRRVLRPVRQNLGTYYLNNIAMEFIPPRNNQPEERGLTPEEINRYTENSIWEETAITQTCPISLEDFQSGDSISKILICGHQFKRDCLERWFQRHSHCPVCRQDVVSYRNQSSSSVSNQDVSGVDAPTENGYQTPVRAASSSGIPPLTSLLQNLFSSTDINQIIQDTQIDLSNNQLFGDELYRIIGGEESTTSNRGIDMLDQELDRIMRTYTTNLDEDTDDDMPDLIDPEDEQVIESVEIIQEIIPMEFEYTIRFDSSNNITGISNNNEHES
jgi:hypothetical protein